MVKNWLALFFAVSLSVVFPGSVSADQLYKVLRVVDGDTVEIEYNGEKEKVRLLCVNTPESVHPEKKQNVPMGKVANKYTKDRSLGRSVALEFEWKLRGR